MEPAAEQAERLLIAFQSTTNELQKTITESCTLIRAEMMQTQQDSYNYKAINDKIKIATNTKWKREGNHKQFDFNNEILEIIVNAQEAGKSGDINSVASLIDSATKKLSNRHKLIRLADSSEGGWGTVKEYAANDLASDSEDEKRMKRAEFRAVKKIKAKSQRGSNRFRPYSTTTSRTNSATFNPYVFNRQAAVPAYTKQGRPGTCFACGSTGHWRKECSLSQSSRVPPLLHTSTQQGTLYSLCPDTAGQTSTKEKIMKDKYIDPILTKHEDFEIEQGESGKHFAFWNDNCNNTFILEVINTGCKIPFKTLPVPSSNPNNCSAKVHSQFVIDSISQLLHEGRIVILKKKWQVLCRFQYTLMEKRDLY